MALPDKVVVVGTGYVGLPMAMMLARSGLDVVGVDVDRAVVESIRRHEMHLDEDELADLMREPEVREHLSAELTPPPADVFVIAVPTPLHRRKKVADLSYVGAAIDSILPVMRDGNLIVVESTIPPLTCREFVQPRLEAAGFRAGQVRLAHCPERILPGNILHEITHNDRVIGGVDAESAEAAKQLYARFVKGKLFVTDDVTAELCKLMENTYRDVNIALANEFEAVGETLGIDIREAINIANRHPRVNILSPGIGVGGHCIPIDPWFIKEVDPENSSLVFASRHINEQKPHKIAARIRHAVRDVESPRIVAIGATYKPDVRDLRESPAIEIVELLRVDGYAVGHFDPVAYENDWKPMTILAEDVDCLVVLVPHRVVRRELADHRDDIATKMRTPVIMEF